MKILPLSIQLFQKSNLKSEKNNTVPVMSAGLGGLQKDTVSFRGNYVLDSYDNLNETINTKILPFVQDSKQIYQSLIDINNEINSIMNKVSKSELKLLMDKAACSDPEQNNALMPYQPFVKRADAYYKNLKEYNNLKNIVKDDTYDSEEIREFIKKADSVMYSQNPEIKKVDSVFHKYNETMINIENFNDSNSLKTNNSPLYRRLRNLKENYLLKVNVFAISLPLADSLRLIRDTQNAGNELKKPTQSLMRTAISIEHLQTAADSIVKNIEGYADKKKKINKFIENYNKYSKNNPSFEEIDAAYSDVSAGCAKAAQKNISKLDEYFDKEYKHKERDIDFDAIDNYLKQQSDIVAELFSKKKAIDEKNIAENNRRVLEQLGYDPSELYDD